MSNPFNDANIRKTLSVVSLCAAIVIAIIAVFTPPMAVIDASILYLTSQFLVFISGLLGVNLEIDFSRHRWTVKQKIGNSEKNSENQEDSDK